MSERRAVSNTPRVYVYCWKRFFSSAQLTISIVFFTSYAVAVLELSCMWLFCWATVTSIHCVSKKDTTQPPTIISTIRFQKFLVQVFLSKYAIQRLFNIPPHLFIVRTLAWETFKVLKITSSAVEEHLFENKQSYLHFICPWLLSASATQAHNKRSKYCLSARTHALSRFSTRWWPHQ